MTMPNQVIGAIPKGKAVLLTGGYDHTIRFWEVHSGLSFRTMQYPDSVRNSLASHLCETEALSAAHKPFASVSGSETFRCCGKSTHSDIQNGHVESKPCAPARRPHQQRHGGANIWTRFAHTPSERLLLLLLFVSFQCWHVNILLAIGSCSWYFNLCFCPTFSI